MQSRFEANDAAEGRGNSNGATGVGADGRDAKASGDGNCGAATGAPGNAIGVPGIAGWAVVGIVGCDTVSEFVEIGFAENNGAGGFEFRNDVGVLFGHEVSQELCSSGGADSRGVNIVFKRDGNAVKRATVAAGFFAARGAEFHFDLAGLSERQVG